MTIWKVLSSFMGEYLFRNSSQIVRLYAAGLLVVIACISSVLADSAEAPYALNYCIDGMYHKEKPGPESDLYKQCSPWKYRSCCHWNTTYNAQHTNHYGFDYNHCAQVKNMSERCKRHFHQDLCFYECSPNVGPWVVEVKMKTRKERFFEVPLCRSDCDSWFEACQDDYTCADNWVRGFTRINNSDVINTCRSDKACRPIKEVFGSAKDFCEKVWDHSWKVLDDDKPCMRIWFNESMDNPNDRVAWNYVYNESGAKNIYASVILIFSILLIPQFL